LSIVSIVSFIIISFVFNYFERSKYQKIFVSLMFINEKNFIWKKNVDLFPNELHKLIYVHSRISDDVVKITQTKHVSECINFYWTVTKLLKELTQSFNDSDKKDNYCRKYMNLFQEFKKFSDCFNQFQRLFFYLNYQKDHIIVDLKNKINSRFWYFWTDQQISFTQLSDIWVYLIRLNNKHKVVQELKKKLFKHDYSFKAIFSKATIVIQSFTLKFNWLKLHDAILTNVKKKADVLVETCFVYYKLNHSFKECLHRFIRINAVDTKSDYKHDYSHSKLNTESKFK